MLTYKTSVQVYQYTNTNYQSDNSLVCMVQLYMIQIIYKKRMS